MIDALGSAILAVLAVLSLPGTLELSLLTLGALLFRPRPREAMPQRRRLAVVIPAYNEELNITSCVRSVQSCATIDAADAIVVVADNCTDRTGEMAAAAGATVLVRREPGLRGKGHALAFAFERLLGEGFEVFCVVDTDTQVAANLIAVLRRSCASGADAVQVRYTARNPHASTHARLQHLALLAFNVVRSRGRAWYGWSAGIVGNGFAVTADTLRAVPLPVDSIVEDLEYHLRLVWAGRAVTWADDTDVWGDMPVSSALGTIQRTRWEGGRWRVFADWVPRLLRGLRRGEWRLLEPLLDLLLLPLAFHVTLLLVLLFLAGGLVQLYAVFALGVVALHVAVAVVVGRASWRDVAALMAAPLYVLWKLSVLPAIIRSSRRGTPWRRSERA